MGVGGQRQALAALPSGKTRYPSYRRVGLDGCGKSRTPPGFGTQTVRPKDESLYRPTDDTH